MELSRKDVLKEHVLKMRNWFTQKQFFKNPRVFLPFLALLIFVLIVTGILRVILSWLFVSLTLIMSVISGISIVLITGKHRIPPTPKPTREQIQVTRTLEMLTKTYSRHYYTHKTVISRQMDKTLQDVIDLVVRDFCLSWFRDIGKDETAFVEILNKEFWKIIENVVERLRNVDLVNFLANDMVIRLSTHFQDLRLSDARILPGQTKPFLLHPALKDKESELEFLRSAAESLLYCVLPPSDAHCTPVRYILREILVNYIFLPTAESVCDPDYLNQTLVIYLEDREKITETHKQQYAYAETYEDFVKLINTTTNIETLKQIRYHTIAEIMQATVIHNMKGIDHKDGNEKTAKRSKKEMLRERNLKRYINQCRVAKSLCEKRIRSLGGPDYRVYGLGHGKPLEGASVQQGKSVKVKRSNSTKILSFRQIMDNSLARSYLMMYLQRNNISNLLGLWMAIERLRLVTSADAVESARDIFQTYITPSAEKIVKLDTRLVRGMEAYLYGNGGPEYFFETQKIIYRTMEEKVYRDFVLSKDYMEYICQSESVIDELRAHLPEGEEENHTLAWSDGMNIREKHAPDSWKAVVPSSIEERNDYSVRKLQILDQNLSAKRQALELSKRALPADPQEIEALEKEVEGLITERRQLEFHIERTDLWCEMLGYWKATIVSAQLDPNDDKTPLLVICISCDEAANKQQDYVTQATGWVVARRLKDFQALHSKLKDCCTWMSTEIPVSSKKWFFNKKYDAAALESLKSSLQEYLSILLQDERLYQSEELYLFLSPSSEQLRGQQGNRTGAGQEKKQFSFVSSLKDSIRKMPFPEILSDSVEEAEEVDAGIEEGVTDRKDSIAEPLYALISEVFELKGVFKYLRRTLIAFVQVTFGGTINRHVREFVEWLVSESMLIYYINNFKDSFWPGGKLAPPYPERTTLEKLRTREKAKEKMMKNIPDVLSNLVGKRNSKLGFIKIFEGFQDIKTNKHIFYVLLELIIITLCPEIKSDEILDAMNRKFGKQLDREVDVFDSM
ncbi:sorting nexin-25-like [Rhopilema esculentum]|uniref:sorting nexin-25-like n=1 Tax=Rhopilema esculentum TaxID=499914 RepID=UPI0031DF67D6